MSESTDGETVSPKNMGIEEKDASREGGEQSVVYHETAMGDLDSVHDDRVRRVLVNDETVPESTEMLVDTVTYDEGVSCPVHYHEDTEHFFYVLEGEGVIEIEGEEFHIEQGSIAWLGENDRHRLYCKEGQKMTVFEFFSNADRETVWTDGPECTWQPDSVSE